MPATIACPKCQTKYQLPESALGKPIKCKKCGAGFRTRAPQQGQSPGTKVASGQRSSNSKPQPSQKELAKYGIDGPIKRQADIFSAPPPPPRSNPLGNFVLEDPGFADVDVARREVREEEGESDGMEAILANPFAAPSARGGKRARKQDDVDLKPYGVARVGMWMVFVSWAILLVTSLTICLNGVITWLAPDFMAAVLAIVMIVMLGLSSFASGFIFIGQIICIFSPNKDEQVFAGLAVGCLVAAAILPIVGVLIGLAGVSVSGAGAEEVATEQNIVALAGGLMVALIVVVAPYALTLANMFFHISYFKKVGNNIRSSEVTAAANQALLAWIAAIAGACVGVIAVIVLVMFFVDAGWLNTVVSLIVLVVLVLGLISMGALVVMVKTTLAKTRPS